MNNLLEILKSDNYIIASFFIIIVLILLVIYCIVKIWKNNLEYVRFMTKLGNGNNLDTMLKEYLNDVNEVKKDNKEIKAYYTKLDYDLNSTIQKIGMVRYNAFRDVGSDLSFALALLDNFNNGVVLNGIYGADASNIYAKPIKNGESVYQLSDEERYAIEIAEQNKYFTAKHKTNQLYKDK